MHLTSRSITHRALAKLNEAPYLVLSKGKHTEAGPGLE